MCLPVLLALLFAAPAYANQPPKDLDAKLRQLEKRIAEVRGLAFKKPVEAKIIPRPQGADKGKQGYYDTREKRLYLYDDISGAYELGVLIHEMVHALQDQHFGLDKLHQATFGSDAELALAALVEGDATYTMIEVLQKEQPKAAAMLNVPLEKSRNLQNAFLYAQGARYVKALKDKGGWVSVNFAYKFRPQTTADILHPAGVATVNLGPGKSVGEYGIIKMLFDQAETKPLAVQAADGWKGDRLAEQDGVKSWVVAFQSKEAAARFHAALVKLRLARDAGLKAVDTTGPNVWQTAQGGLLAVLPRGDRVVVLESPNLAAHRRAIDRLESGPQLRVYDRKQKREVSFGDMVERLLEADLVCVGETHDSEPHHQVQLRIIKALHAHDERLGVGMEMFQRPFQAHIDKYFRGESHEEAFLKDSEYKQRWGFDWALYRPIVEFCRRNALPLAALNVPRELTRKISKGGVASLSDDEKKQLGPVDFQVKEHRDHWYERLAKMHGNTKATPEQKERSYQVMTVWDDYMGQSAAAFQQERQLRRLVVLAGSGHIERGFGIPLRAARRTGGVALTVGIHFERDQANPLQEPLTDYVIVIR
jgi:uncharacterized iron-regulated protein